MDEKHLDQSRVPADCCPQQSTPPPDAERDGGFSRTDPPGGSSPVNMGVPSSSPGNAQGSLGWEVPPPGPGGYPYGAYGAAPYYPSAYGFPQAALPPMETPEQRRNRTHRFYVKKCGGHAGKFLLLQWGMAQGIAVMATILFLVLQIAGQGNFQQDTALSGDWYLFVCGMLPALFADIAAVCIAPRFLRIRLGKGLFSKGESKAGMTLLGMGACGGCAAAAVGVMQLLDLLFGAVGMETPGVNLTLPTEFDAVWVLSTLYICLLGPTFEELIFRGFLLKHLRRYGDRFAILMTAILFTLFHMNPTQLVLPFLTGLLLAFLTVRSGSLWPAILCHIFNNSMSTLCDTLSQHGAAAGEWLYLVYLTGGLVCLVAFCLGNSRRIQEVSAGDTTVLATRGKIACALSAGPNIALFLIYGITTDILFMSALSALY